MGRKRIEFKAIDARQRLKWETILKIASGVLPFIGVGVIILSLINQSDILLGVVITIVGIIVAVITYKCTRQKIASTVWLEGGYLYIKGGGLPEGYIRCADLGTVKSIWYNRKTKEYGIQCRHKLVYPNMRTGQLSPVMSSKDEITGYDIYKPSLVNVISNLCRVPVKFMDK